MIIQVLIIEFGFEIATGESVSKRQFFPPVPCRQVLELVLL